MRHDNAVGRPDLDALPAARAKLLALPDRVSQMLPVTPEIRRQSQELIQTEVYAALDELAEEPLVSCNTKEKWVYAEMSGSIPYRIHYNAL